MAARSATPPAQAPAPPAANAPPDEGAAADAAPAHCCAPDDGDVDRADELPGDPWRSKERGNREVGGAADDEAAWADEEEEDAAAAAGEAELETNDAGGTG